MSIYQHPVSCKKEQERDLTIWQFDPQGPDLRRFYRSSLIGLSLHSQILGLPGPANNPTCNRTQRYGRESIQWRRPYLKLRRT